MGIRPVHQARRTQRLTPLRPGRRRGLGDALRRGKAARSADRGWRGRRSERRATHGTAMRGNDAFVLTLLNCEWKRFALKAETI